MCITCSQTSCKHEHVACIIKKLFICLSAFSVKTSSSCVLPWKRDLLCYEMHKQNTLFQSTFKVPLIISSIKAQILILRKKNIMALIKLSKWTDLNIKILHKCWRIISQFWALRKTAKTFFVPFYSVFYFAELHVRTDFSFAKLPPSVDLWCCTYRELYLQIPHYNNKKPFS